MVTTHTRLLILIFLFACEWIPSRALGQSKVTISRAAQSNTVVINQPTGEEAIYQMEVSSDMSSWKPWVLSWGPFTDYVDLSEVY
jgi:hypothetical protein